MNDEIRELELKIKLLESDKDFYKSRSDMYLKAYTDECTNVINLQMEISKLQDEKFKLLRQINNLKWENSNLKLGL